MIEIVDQSNSDLYSQNQDLINNFADYSSKNLDFDKPVKVYFMDDAENAKDPLGKTAYYDPDKMEIKIYITGRHLKDILRSISHELIHHVQNCRGDFGSLNQTSPGYAQEDDHLRGMEHEAYTMGNIMNFRDFEDNYKKPGAGPMSEQKINKLRALVREGVKQVLSEISIVGVPSEIRKKAMASPEYAGRYLAAQNNSDYVNEDEGLVVQNSVNKWLEVAKSDPTIAKRFTDAYYEGGGKRPMEFKTSFSPFSDVREPAIDKKLSEMEKISKSTNAEPTPDSSGGVGGRQLEPGRSMAPSSDKTSAIAATSGPAKQPRPTKPAAAQASGPGVAKSAPAAATDDVGAVLAADGPDDLADIISAASEDAEDYTGIAPRLIKALKAMPKKDRSLQYTQSNLWRRTNRNEQTDALRRALINKGWKPAPMGESLTIEQKKLTEAKSLFERLKKVL